MNEMSDWIQNNWFELGSFLVQLGVLLTLAWFGRKLLKLLAFSHGRSEELRQASSPHLAAGMAPEQVAPESTFAPYGYGGVVEHRPGAIVTACRDMVAWLQAPMGSGSRGASPVRRMIRWLQAPMGS